MLAMEPIQLMYVLYNTVPILTFLGVLKLSLDVLLARTTYFQRELKPHEKPSYVR